MGRRLKIDRPKSLEVQIPSSVYLKIRMELYSEIEGKVPFGALSNLATELFSDWLRSRGIVL